MGKSKNFFQKISKFEDAEQSPGFLMWQASTLWRRKIEQCLVVEKLSHSAFVILAVTGFYTANNDSEFTQKKLSEMSCLDQNVISQLLKKLIMRHLIKRNISHIDTRAKVISLTDAGQKMVQKLIPQVEAIDQEVFGKNNQAFCKSLLDIIHPLIS